MDWNVLLMEEAKKAMVFSYSPYSNFKVGAALLTEDDAIYTGCNIENASYGATNCAERTAIFKAVSEGKRHFKKMAVASSSKDYTMPCGICRQVLGEFMPDGEIILFNEKEMKAISVKELLPFMFTKDDIQ